MPYLMELELKKKAAEYEAEIADRDRQIAQLKKVIAYNVNEIKLLKSRLVALGEPLERTDYLSWKTSMSSDIPRDGDQL